MRFFNTEGSVRPVDHDCLPPLERWNLDEVLALIEQKNMALLLFRRLKYIIIT